MISKISKHATYASSTSGPTFGAGTGIYIASNSNASLTSFPNITNSYYQRPHGISDHYFLNGQKKFKVSEIEVFQV